MNRFPLDGEGLFEVEGKTPSWSVVLVLLCDVELGVPKLPKTLLFWPKGLVLLCGVELGSPKLPKPPLSWPKYKGLVTLGGVGAPKMESGADVDGFGRGGG